MTNLQTEEYEGQIKSLKVSLESQCHSSLQVEDRLRREIGILNTIINTKMEEMRFKNRIIEELNETIKMYREKIG